MRAEIRYISIGLFIGISGIAFLLAKILTPFPGIDTFLPDTEVSWSSSTPSLASDIYTTAFFPLADSYQASSTFTFTPTYIRPTETPTITNTPTLTPTVSSPTPSLSGTMNDLLKSGYLSQRGPLSLEQQLNLFRSSIKFIRHTTEESRQLGNMINGRGEGAPGNICGPLAIAILQDAGIIRTSLSPHTFWLLNPDVLEDRKYLNSAFPPILFENIQYNHKLNEIDWKETPLFPGDFIYIYAGKGGNFEHMLVVNRVDADGRVYSVTNYNTPDGFIIDEVLLYDPTDASTGIFSLWTARPFAKIGSTGFGGIEIWRYNLLK